jgi:hypothetical protein
LLQYSLSHDLYQICNRGNGSRIPSSSSPQTEANPFPDTRTHYLTPREAGRLSKQSQTAHPPRDLSFRQAFAKPSRYLLANASLPSISSPHLQRCSRGQNSPNTPPRHICSSTAWCARRGCCQVHDRTAHRRSLLRMCTSHSIPIPYPLVVVALGAQLCAFLARTKALLSRHALYTDLACLQR